MMMSVTAEAERDTEQRSVEDAKPTEVQRAYRTWPASYKLRILAEIDAAKDGRRGWCGGGDHPPGGLVLLVDL